VAAIAQSISAGQGQTYDSLHQMRAASVAESLMEELVATPYFDDTLEFTRGPEEGEATRADFDSLDDYLGYSEAAGELKDVAGNALDAPLQVFSRSVTLVGATVDIPAFGGEKSGLTITITVTDQRGRTWTISRFVPEPAI